MQLCHSLPVTTISNNELYQSLAMISVASMQLYQSLTIASIFRHATVCISSSGLRFHQVNVSISSERCNCVNLFQRRSPPCMKLNQCIQSIHPLYGTLSCFFTYDFHPHVAWLYVFQWPQSQCLQQYNLFQRPQSTARLKSLTYVVMKRLVPVQGSLG